MATAVDGLGGTERHWRGVFAGMETLERLFPAATDAEPRASHP